MAVDVGSAVGYLDIDISRFLAGLKSAQSEADTASKNMTTKIGNNFKSIGKSLTSVGSTLTKKVTIPLAAIGTAGLKVATDFEKGMSEVKAISGATGKDFVALRDKAIELGADTAFSANEVANAMTEMAKAGWNSSQIIDGMNGVLAAAAASGEELSTVSTIVADAITGFGLAAADSTKVADLLTQAANSGTIGIGDLGESFKYIAPVAGAMGLSIEDVTTALSAMSMAGIKGSQAGTSLRTMLTRMTKPTDDVAAAMNELGISVTNQDGSMKSLDDIVSNLRTSFDGLTESEKAKYAATLAGQEGMAGMLSLLNLTEDEYNEIANSMDNANGVAEKTATTMQDNLQSKVEQLGGSLESLAIKLADYIVPSLQKFVEWLTNLVDKFTSLNPETQKAILIFAAISAAIGPVLTTLGKLTSSIGSISIAFGKIPAVITKVKGAFTTISAAIGGISAPVVAIVAIIGILIAAFMHLWKTNEGFRNKITAIWDGLKSKFESFAQGIVDRLNALGFDFKNFGEVIKAIWDGFCNLLAPIFEGVFNQISTIFSSALDILTGIFDVFIGVFTGNWDQAWQGVKEIFGAIWNLIKETFESWIAAFKDLASKALSWFKEKWNEMLTFFSELPYKIGYWLGQVIGKVIIWAKEFPEKAKTAATNFVDNLKTRLTELPGKVKDWLDKVLNKIGDFVVNFTLRAKMAAQEFKERLIEGVKELPEKMKTVGNDIVEGTWNGIKSAKDTFVSNVKNFFSGIVDGVKDTLGIGSPSKVFRDEIGKWLPPGVVKGFEAAMPSAMKAIQKVLNKGIDNIDANDISAGASITVSGFVDKLKLIYNEVALWFESIESRIGNSIDSMMQSLDMLIRAGQVIVNSDGTLGYIGYNGFTKSDGSDDYVDRINPKDKDTSGNGDTFIFNSPKPIDEIEAAKQMKKTKQDMAEGF